jgi:hypothetical protein
MWDEKYKHNCSRKSLKGIYRTWEGNIKVVLKEIVWDCVYWIDQPRFHLSIYEHGYRLSGSEQQGISWLDSHYQFWRNGLRCLFSFIWMLWMKDIWLWKPTEWFLLPLQSVHCLCIISNLNEVCPCSTDTHFAESPDSENQGMWAKGGTNRKE